MSHVDFLYKQPCRDIRGEKIKRHEEANFKTGFTDFSSYFP
jgi:hypothetical protein